MDTGREKKEWGGEGETIGNEFKLRKRLDSKKILKNEIKVRMLPIEIEVYATRASLFFGSMVIFQRENGAEKYRSAS